ncbi:hypothetical protein BDV96DRAFT_647017 [Lophiotrema nucula]|uniref:Uncharacterized protein n=1 Tax=Lophiotrema nucula TaxID=690887 RepID=A0A6A5Z7G0_9PLEO|nr:hypothetical protein BDV96DRAFT_647017 [Lophiotrema nucula]
MANQQISWEIDPEKVRKHKSREWCDHAYGDHSFPIPEEYRDLKRPEICKTIVELLDAWTAVYEDQVENYQEDPTSTAAQDWDVATEELRRMRQDESLAWVFDYDPYKLIVGINKGEADVLIHEITRARLRFDNLRDNNAIVNLRFEGTGLLDKNRPLPGQSVEEEISQEPAGSSTQEESQDKGKGVQR